MNIQFDNVDFNSRSGPNSFAKRLGLQLQELGHNIVNDHHKADVSLVFIEPSGKPLCKKIVQRLDGIWFSPREFQSKNTRIKWLYHNADHVIWQSTFDEQMTKNWWKEPKAGTVIRNGMSTPSPIFDPGLQKKLEELKSKHEKIFVCSANWHPQKRLKDNVELFKHLKKRYSTACLIVMGSNANITESDVYVTGNLPHEICLQIMKSADWMFHLAWLDHCPNTVVEALTCNLPVICSEDGGTKELVGDYGIVLKETNKYQFELTEYEKPPALNLNQVIDLPDRVALGSHNVSDIKKVAELYLKVFESVTLS